MISSLDLAQAILPCGRGLMAMISLFADDSSDQKQQEWLSVGAIAGWPLDLYEASRQWEKLLTKHGLAYFRAAECYNASREFSRFRRDKSVPLDEAFKQTAAIQDEFIDVINRHPLEAFGFSMDLRDFRKVMAADSRARKMLHAKPSIVLYRKLITAVIDELVITHGGHYIAFIFDSHSDWRTAEEEYEKLREEDSLCERMMGHLGHDDDKQYAALQMADLLASESRRAAYAYEGKAALRDAFQRLEPAWKVAGLIREAEIIGGIERYIKRNPDRWREWTDETEERTREARRNHAEVDCRSALGDQGKARRGKGSPKAET